MKYETCVLCGATTNVPVDMPIDMRPTYVPGSGQLCEPCCRRLYGKTDLRGIGNWIDENSI